MTRIKSAALTVAGSIVALAILGFFASLGLALIGALAAIGAVAAVVAGVSALFAGKDTTAPVSA